MLQKLFSDTRGNLSLTFAGLLPVIIGIAGGAMDFSKMNAHRSGLQNVLDSTVLAAAGGQFGPPSKLDKAAAKSYAASLAVAGGYINKASDLQFDMGVIKSNSSSSAAKNEVKQKVWGTASAPVDTYFLDIFKNLIGSTSANASTASGLGKVSTYSEATAGLRKNLEIVLVLDNTGSMGSRNKMKIMKEASLNFVNDFEVLSKMSDDKWVKMGLVPFTTQIRFDARYKNDGWVGYKDKDHKNGWSGCIWDRDGKFDSHVGYDGSEEQKFSATDNYYVGKNLRVEKHCHVAHSLPLMENLGHMRGGINSMKANGYTNIGLGLVWGWNFLDPGEPFTEGVPYSDEDTLKIIILLTDGDNTFNRRGYTEDKKSWNSAYEDTPTKETCDNLKETNIQVYTIRVVDGNRSLLQNCATRPDMFYDVDDPDDLIPVFEEIALHIKHIYLAY